MSEERIYRYVARVGTLKWLGQFGSISRFELARDEPIIVATSRGLFLGYAIEAVPSTPLLPKPLSTADTPKLTFTGEMIRKATEADLRTDEDHRRWCQAQFDLIYKIVCQRCPSAVPTDIELTIDGKHLLIWFIGQSSSALGPLTLEFSQNYSLESVQFISVDNATPFEVTADAPPSPHPSPEPTPPNPWSGVLAESRNEANRFSKETGLQLQQHGIYQQKLRPSRSSVVHNWSTPSSAMIRLRRNPYGWTLSQIKQLLDIAGRYGDGWLRPTLRQGWQIYGVPKQRLSSAIIEIDSLLLTSQGACGNNVRSVTCCPLHAYGSTKHRWAFETAVAVEQLLRPKGELYEIIWLDGDSEFELPDETNSALPHKFKIAVATDDDYCTEPRANDIGIVINSSDLGEASPTLEAQIFLGGGLGFRFNDTATFAQLGEYCGTIAPNDILPWCNGIVSAYRKYAPHRRRRQARFKYWLREIGRQEIIRLSLAEATRPIQVLEHQVSVPPPRFINHTGWHIFNGHRFYGLRWKQFGFYAGDPELSNTLTHLTDSFLQRWHITSGQEVVVGPLKEEQLSRVAKLVSNNSLANYFQASELRIDQQSEAGNMDQAHLIACPALPTCSQAVSEAESYRAELLSIFESIENRLNLPLGKLQVRIAGCSNNCSRPLLAHIGLIGQGTDRYAIFFGGSIRKSTLAKHVEGTWPWGPKLFETLERLCLLVYQTSTSTECCSMNQFNLAECFESISKEQLELISSQLTKDL